MHSMSLTSPSIFLPSQKLNIHKIQYIATKATAHMFQKRDLTVWQTHRAAPGQVISSIYNYRQYSRTKISLKQPWAQPKVELFVKTIGKCYNQERILMKCITSQSSMCSQQLILAFLTPQPNWWMQKPEIKKEQRLENHFWIKIHEI